MMTYYQQLVHKRLQRLLEDGLDYSEYSVVVSPHCRTYAHKAIVTNGLHYLFSNEAALVLKLKIPTAHITPLSEYITNKMPYC